MRKKLKALKKLASIITPILPFKKNNDIQIGLSSSDHPINGKLQDIIDATGGYQNFNISIKPKKKKINLNAELDFTAKKNTNQSDLDSEDDKEDDFDSIWTSL